MDTRKIAIQQKVKNCMEENLETWSSVLEMEKVYDQFIKNLKKIEDLFPDTQVDLNPMAGNVSSSKEKLISILLPISKVLSVYASDNGCSKLEKRAKVTSAQLVKMKAGELEKHAYAIWKAIDEIMGTGEENPKQAKKKIKPVSNYGLSSKMIDSLFQTATEYSNLRQTLKEAKKTNKKAEKEIDKLIRENNKLLKERLDKFIFLFEDSGPGFFNCYMLARKNKPVPVNNENTAEKAEE